jgi:hypothetical protein
MIEEGICDRPADLDLAMINGTGFPAYRGGILRCADAWGLKAAMRSCSSFNLLGEGLREALDPRLREGKIN